MTEKTRKAVEQFERELIEKGKIECVPYYFGVSRETIKKYVKVEMVTLYDKDETIEYIYLDGWNKWVSEAFKNRRILDDKSLVSLVTHIADNFNHIYEEDSEYCEKLALFMDLRYLSDKELCEEWTKELYYGKLVIKNDEWMIERCYHKSANYYIKR